MSAAKDSHEPEEPPIRFTNNRKIDRDKPAEQHADGGDATPPPAAAAEPATEEEVAMVEASLLDERTADLQRVQAEYANYRRRSEREISLAADAGVAKALAALLPVVDDVDRARAHGDVTGPFGSIVEKLDRQLEALGLTAFGDVGDPFDPNKHEAVAHDERDDVAVPTCTTIMRKGYSYKTRQLRAAMVGVSDPASAGSDSEADAQPAPEDEPADT